MVGETINHRQPTVGGILFYTDAQEEVDLQYNLHTEQKPGRYI